MIVLLDCDGVLADFTGGLVRELNKKYDAKFKTSDVKTDKISESIGVPESDVYEIADVPGFCFGLNPYPEALEGVKKLRKNHDVYIVTSPITSSKTWVYERTQWLKKHFDIDHKHVISASAKERVHGDVLVDDKPANLERWKNVWIAGRALLKHQPWNESYPAIFFQHPIVPLGPIVRVQNWSQILTHLG